MKKFYFLILALLLTMNSAFAKVRSITDWENKLDSRVNLPNKQISCEEKCPGYDITTTMCYTMGETLESCPEEGCGYYYRCTAQQ